MTSGEFQVAKSLVQTILRQFEIPTKQQIKHAIAEIVGMPMFAGKIDAGALERDIQSVMNILVPEGTELQDRTGHEDWLPEKENSLPWHFWKRYIMYMEQDKGMPPQVIESLDKLSRSILEKIEDPQRTGAWDRRGMVVGQVQSGKTANYTGLICKAVDSGYKLVIVLAGVHNSLRSQTQLRLDEGFRGQDSNLDRVFKKEIAKIGAGRHYVGADLPVHSLTTNHEGGDFKKSNTKSVATYIGSDPVLLVIKKNGGVLRNLLRWVQATKGTKDASGQWKIKDLPLLVIDDEADHASVNTNEVERDLDTGMILEDQKVSVINGLVRELLNTFEKSAYVGYTATPFANIFIYPHGKDDKDKFGDDLFPRSFIINLPSPSNYIGPVQVFGLEEYPDANLKAKEGLPIIRPVRDTEGLLPSAHNKELRPQSLPDSLKHALRAFILTCAARAARGQDKVHNTMLVHVTRFTAVQQAVYELVEGELTSLQRRLRTGDGERTPSLRDELQALWESDFVPTTAAVIRQIDDEWMRPLAWSEVEGCLTDAALKIEMKLLNGLAQDALEYYERSGGISVIAIGGDKLSRGLTLEGLSVSYYLRSTKMYDTLMQMGRWFGYRPGYADLCRLYTTRELISWYRHITVASEELRQDFDRMARLKATPELYGLRVQTHPGGLLVTAVNKMRSGTKMRVSFDLKLIESTVFTKDLETIRHNMDAAAAFFQALADVGIEPIPEGSDTLWQNVPGATVADFLGSLQAHPQSLAQPDKLRDYILKKLPHGELTEWTVVLNGNKQSEDQWELESLGIKAGLTYRRSADETPTEESRYMINRRHIVSAGDEMRDLTEPQRAAALDETVADWARSSSEKDAPKSPSGMRIRERRELSRGLLLLYLLDPKAAFGEEHQVEPFVGCAISFPGTAIPGEAAEYVVNKIYLGSEDE